MANPNDTGLAMLTIPLAMGARLGIRESRSNVNECEILRDWNGGPLVVASPFPKKAKISLAASGHGVRIEPAFDGVQIGDTVTLYSRKTSVAFIGSGGNTAVLHWPVVPGSKVVATTVAGNKPVSINVFVSNGQTIAYLNPNATEDVVVSYFPVIDCIIKSWGGSAATSDGNEDWSAELEEV
jgi:hypothetical protein